MRIDPSSELVTAWTSLRDSVLARHSAVYFGFTLAHRLVPFLLLPILTRYLSPADYGRVAMYATLVGICTIFCGPGVKALVQVDYFRRSPDAFATGFSSLLLVVTGASGVVALVVLAARGPIASLTHLPSVWVAAAVGTAVAQLLFDLRLNLWQNQRRPARVGSGQVTQRVSQALLTLALVVGLGFGFRGPLTSLTLTMGVAGLLALVSFSREGLIRPGVDRRALRDALDFGLPLVPRAFAIWTLLSTDKLVLERLVGIDAVGRFAVALTVGMTINVVTTAVNAAFVPFVMERLRAGTPRDKERAVAAIYLLAVSFLVAAGGIVLAAWWLLPFLVGERFHGIEPLVLWIAPAFALHGIGLLLDKLLQFAKATRWIAAVSITVAALHVAITFALVARFGVEGAAWALVVSYGLLMGGTGLASRRVMPMPWRATARRLLRDPVGTLRRDGAGGA